jgi:hypothetical protein
METVVRISNLYSNNCIIVIVIYVVIRKEAGKIAIHSPIRRVGIHPYSMIRNYFFVLIICFQ